MKYVVFNGEDCNIAGDFGAACIEYKSRGVLEVVRIGTGKYNIFWDTPFLDNNYVILTNSNFDGSGGAYSSIGGNNDALNDNFGVSRRFVTIQTRKLGFENAVESFSNSDYIVVVADPDFSGIKKLVFNGQDCSGNGQFGNSCNILSVDNNNEILEVIEQQIGSAIRAYDIFFANSFANNNYLILTSSNVEGTGGTVSSIGGNNNINSEFDFVNTDICRIDTRRIHSTSQRGNSDYISFIAGVPIPTDIDSSSLKYVTFDGTDCNDNGINGIKCNIFDSNDVLEVIKINNGIYKIFWQNEFKNNSYVLLCDSNLRGTSGAICGIGGNNIGSDQDFGISTSFGEIEIRDVDIKFEFRNSDYISVLAF